MSEQIRERILELENQLTRSPQSDAYFPLAQLYRQIGEPKKACDICVHGLKHHPDSYVGYLILGNILSEQERFDSAEKAYATAFKIDPSQSEPLFLLCDVYIKTNKIGKLNAVLHQLEIVAPYDARLKKIRATIKELKAQIRKTRQIAKKPQPSTIVQNTAPVDDSYTNQNQQFVQKQPYQRQTPVNEPQKTSYQPQAHTYDPTPKKPAYTEQKPNHQQNNKVENPDNGFPNLSDLATQFHEESSNKKDENPIEPRNIDFETFVDRVFALDGVSGVVFLDEMGQINRSMDCDIEVAKSLAAILRAYKKAFDISFNVLKFGEWTISSIFMEFGFVFLINIGDYKIAFNCDSDAAYGPMRVKISSILRSFT